jgi:glycosyltransferase involved in cell wall biosynthesis
VKTGSTGGYADDFALADIFVDSRDDKFVVLVTTALIRGGVWRHIEDLDRELRRLGHDVVVALRPEAEHLRASARESGLPVADLSRTITWRRCIWHAHLHDTFDRALAAAVIARRTIGPTVLTEHLPRTNASDDSLLPGPRRPFARRAKTVFKRAEFACTDAVIAVSPSSADFLTARYGVQRKRIDVVMNGIRRSNAPVISRPNDPTVRVVSVGSVIHQKGHDLLLRAALSSRGGWQATVFGDGPLREPLARRAAADALPVTFSGWSDDIGGVLGRADVACLPSRWESFGYSALEAMNAGLPVVAADVDGLRDLVEPGVTGVLVPPDDEEALAAALDLLSSDADARRRMGEAARERASRFTVERMADETAAVYRRVADRRASATSRRTPRWRERP